jgi:hypothetical protein
MTSRKEESGSRQLVLKTSDQAEKEYEGATVDKSTQCLLLASVK